MSRKKVVVTGMSLITSVGLDLETSWAAMKAGKSGVIRGTKWDLSTTPTKIAAELPAGFPDMVRKYTSKRFMRQASYSGQLALVLAKQLVEKYDPNFAKLDRSRIGVILGTGGSGGYDPDTFKPDDTWAVIKNMPNAMAGWITMEFGLEGSAFTVNSACASGADALGVAHTLITSGRLDMVLAGGADAVVNRGSIMGFNHLMALSERNDEPTRASRPFDKNRNGFVMGEGGGMVFLESEEHALARGARILCEHPGYASTNEASNIMAPKEGGVGMAIAMRKALEDAGMSPEEIQYVSAHGTSTGHNDRCESQGIRRAFGAHADKLAVSSQKSMIGHSLGAAGAIEFVVSALSILDDFASPTINYETPDPDCDLDYVPNVGRQMEINAAISNSFGFGGHNTTHVLRKYRG